MRVEQLWSEDNSHDFQKGSSNPPSWPNEMLVKVLSSSSYSSLGKAIPKNAKVLEVGIFSGNNARFLMDLGFQVHGSEVNENLINLCRKNLSRLDEDFPTLVIGTNNNIPYPDSTFDLLISINTIHYSPGLESDLAIKEFRRVLKPGGIAIIETAGNKHFAVRASERISERNWIFGIEGFRKGSSVGFFDNEAHFKNSLENQFKLVEICSRTEEYPERQLHFYMSICQKE